MIASLAVFFAVFLGVCFFLIFRQRDLTNWQKFSLLINPAIWVLLILIMFAKTGEERDGLSKIVPAAEAVTKTFSRSREGRADAARKIRQWLNTSEKSERDFSALEKSLSDQP